MGGGKRNLRAIPAGRLQQEGSRLRRAPLAALAGWLCRAAVLGPDRGLTLIEVLVAVMILVVAVVPLMDALGRSLVTGEQAGQESLRIYLAQSKMEQYLQWFREYRGQGDELEERLETDGVDLDPADGFNPEPQPFDGFPGYAYRASLNPRYGGGEARALRQLRVEVTGPEGRQVALTTLVW